MKKITPISAISLSKQWDLNLFADNLLDEEYGYAMPGIVVGSIV